MCIACKMGFGRRKFFQLEFWRNDADFGNMLLLGIGRLGFSVSDNRVRPWLRPEHHWQDGGMYGFVSGKKYAVRHHSPRVDGWMWGVFHLVWESDPPIQLGITR